MKKQIDKKVRAKALKDLTKNGKNRYMIAQLDRLMSDKETLEILNALFAATN
jgi:hypothetical protein